jgi:hypothetical protein
MTSNTPVERRHAVIGGTGRSGTTFLVKFLDACGLDTGSDVSGWFPRARAGHEHALDAGGHLPYVVKDPWLFTYCEQLDLGELRIDALIVPTRDLMQAAESRAYQERLALTEDLWFQGRDVQVSAKTAGGVVYSLDAVDQARLLAVGFYNLLRWVAAEELPLYLLDFPRLVDDRDYTLRKLWPWLGEHCSIEVARQAFAAASNPDAVRIRRGGETGRRAVVLGEGEPDRGALDRTALVERIDELAAALTLAREEIARMQIHRCDENVVKLPDRLDEVHESASWRLTAALRAAKHGISRVRPVLRRSATPERNQSLLAGMSVSQVWWFALLLTSTIAATDTIFTHIVLITLLAAGPFCGLLTGRWTRTAIVGIWAVTLAVVLGFPDQIWGTSRQLVDLSIVAAVALLSTLAAIPIERWYTARYVDLQTVPDTE